MATSSHPILLLLLLLFVLAAAVVSPAAATDHIVGANRGWNPGINYTLWANNHTFYVGDLISFRYQKNQYNVFKVNRTGYDNCTTEGATGNWSSGKDFILLDKAKRYYFICGNGQCFNGMKVSVLVHPLPPPPSASVAAGNSSSASADRWVLGNGSLGSRVLVALVGSVWIGIGSGWFF
ncbi:early nodulin-like protein 17 [Syzygium oleosum]|uniref:early nodulin-like protein 17 n=1 Tax=Syzygium oleosum TaxID=219896 RepID=UPI0011D1BF49|nr:early nodulin-like protein 17 [Syzygium oleosum]